jgi:hypothetical protein
LADLDIFFPCVFSAPQLLASTADGLYKIRVTIEALPSLLMGGPLLN